MAVTTKKTFAATTNATTTVFSPVSIQLHNQDDLDVYVTLSGGTRVLQLRQSTGSTATSSHPQVNNTDGLYFPAVTAGTTLYNYQLSSDNNTITFNSALPQGAVVFCERRTRDASGTYTNFASGSTIRARDLNDSSEQSNFTAQDARNKALEIEGALFNGGAITSNFVTSEKIVDGSILDADINANANIQGSKLANDSVSLDKLGSGNLPSDIQVDSSNIGSGGFDDRYYTETELDGGQLDNRYYTETELSPTANAGQNVLDARYYTETELGTDGVLDSRYLTQSAADARYFNMSTGDTIKDGDPFPDNDTTIATTAAINDRIIDLVDDVGGFVPIANETSFPNANPDVNNGTGTLVSVPLANNLTSDSNGNISIANGTVGNSTVTITGATPNSTFTQGFGIIVETSATLNTYTFHRYVPKATEVTTVASKATEIGLLGTPDVVEDLSILGTTDVVADMAILATTDVVSDLNTLGTADVVADMNTLAVPSVVNNLDTVATDIANVNNVGGSIASVNTAANNLTDLNNFGDKYQIASSDPSTDGGGNALAEGDLYFNTSSDELRVYNGTTWQGGVTASGNLAGLGSNTFTGDQGISNEKELRLFEATANGTNYVGLKAPSSVTTNTTFNLPDGDGTNGQVIKTDGNGNLSFGTVTSIPTALYDSANTSSQVISTGSGLAEVLGNNKLAFDRDTTNANKIAFQAPSSHNDITFTLPAADGTSGQVLKTDGSGVLSFTDAGSGLVGSSNEKLFVEAENAMDNDFTTTAGNNYVSASPLTLNATLTVVSGSTMSFV